MEPLRLKRGEIRPDRPPDLLAAAGQVLVEGAPLNRKNGGRTGVDDGIASPARDLNQGLVPGIHEGPGDGLGTLSRGGLLQAFEDLVEHRIIDLVKISQRRGRAGEWGLHRQDWPQVDSSRRSESCERSQPASVQVVRSR